MTECVLTSHTAESVKNLIFIAGIVYVIVHVIAYISDHVVPKAKKFYEDCKRALEDAGKAIRDNEESVFLLTQRIDAMEARMQEQEAAADRRASLRPRRQ